jgi:hypothetical protein
MAVLADGLGNDGDGASQDGRDGGGGAAERGEAYGDGEESRGHRSIVGVDVLRGKRPSPLVERTG